MNETRDDAQVYEIGYLVLPSIPEGEVSSVEDTIKKAIEASGGKELASESPEKIDLAYAMTKVVGASRYVVNDAYIGWIKFEALPSAIPALKETVAKMDEIVRSLLLKVPADSSFTFAKARALMEKEEEVAEEAESAPKEVVE